MVLDTLYMHGETDHSSTTLTPTTLRQITQIFESDDCLSAIKNIKESDYFVPAPAVSPPSSTAAQRTSDSKKIIRNVYSGGTTTVVTPSKVEPEPTIELVRPKVERQSLSEFDDEDSEDDQSLNHTDDEEYRPTANSRKMQTRNGGKRKAGSFSAVVNTGRGYTRTNSRGAAKDQGPSAKKRRGNLKNDYDTLPPTERERLRQRRERNKEAAARCRQRREELTYKLMDEVKMWEGKNGDLEAEIQKLHSDMQDLQYILQNHNCCLNDNNNKGLVGTTANSSNTNSVFIAVKSEPSVIVEAVNAPYLIPTTTSGSSVMTAQKRHRPSSLSIPNLSGPSNNIYLESSGPEGVLIETPSTVISSFESFLNSSSGLTPPVISGLMTPLFYSSSLMTPTTTTTSTSTCASQQRNTEDLNTPATEIVSLVSL